MVISSLRSQLVEVVMSFSEPLLRQRLSKQNPTKVVLCYVPITLFLGSALLKIEREGGGEQKKTVVAQIASQLPPL